MLRTSQSLLSGRRSRHKKRIQWLFCCFKPKFIFRKRQPTLSRNRSQRTWSLSNSQDGIYSESLTSSFDVIHDISATQADEIVADEDRLATKTTHLGCESFCLPNSKKRFVPLISLLPLHIFANKSCKTAIDNVEENSSNFTFRDKLLCPPQINLIPPTPSDVLNCDQFFESKADNEGICIVEQHGGTERMDDMSSIDEGSGENNTNKENGVYFSNKTTPEESKTECSQGFPLENNAVNETGDTTQSTLDEKLYKPHICQRTIFLEVFGYVWRHKKLSLSFYY
ncbi:hypothetical protein XELAEV_18026451mg [Xenopus laevis]|uniref:Uncharacterized protein n=1 Tax=Xenopus laevis TaxID=8355 RepID=A0A974CTS7_XENLA|nr:hypothetical protein XELAEV_18026451mg [Xenopus laevis]